MTSSLLLGQPFLPLYWQAILTVTQNLQNVSLIWPFLLTPMTTCLLEITIIFCFCYWNPFYKRFPCFCSWPLSIFSQQDCSEQFVSMNISPPTIPLLKQSPVVPTWSGLCYPPPSSPPPSPRLPHCSWNTPSSLLLQSLCTWQSGFPSGKWLLPHFLQVEPQK